MEIRRWQMYVVINCVIVAHLVAKPVSLNELIAAESKQKQKSQYTKPTVGKTISLNDIIAAERKQKKSQNTPTKHVDGATTAKPFSTKDSYPAESRQKLENKRGPKISAKKPRRKSFSLKELFTAERKLTKRRLENLLPKTSGAGLFAHRKNLIPVLSRKSFESADDIFSFSKTISPLKFRKRFEIESPLKPKKIKYSFAQRQKLRNQSTKREVNENEIFGHKYIPLIKRIGLLVDDILSPDSGESVERLEPGINRRKRRRNNPKVSNYRKDRDLEAKESKPQKTTTVSPTPVSPETTTEIITDTTDTPTATADTTAYTTPVGDVNTLRPDPDLPLSPARNTSSDRRDYNGIGEGSGSPFHRDFEGYIARNNRSDEHNSRGERNQTYSSSNEENPCGSTRVHSGSDGSGTGINTRIPNATHKTEETKISSCEDKLVRGNDAAAKDIFQVGRQQETLQIPRNVRRLPGGLPDHKVFIVDAESVPPKKSCKESFINVTNNHTSAERRAEWDGAAATENQRLRQVIEGVIPIQELINPNFLKQHSQHNQVVTIFDGYSVARDINGRNKLSEKSIRISPN